MSKSAAVFAPGPRTSLSVRGVEVPRFLYGTAWKEERTEELTALALRAGFVGIDTANQRKHYVEAAVGAAAASAMSDARLTRSELFLQTKFTFAAGQDHRLPYDPGADISTQVAQSFQSSLEHLRTEYIDSYILHGPSSRSQLTRTDWDAWHAMESLQRTGKARLIGVSNVSLDQLSALFEGAEVKPAFVQNRCYAKAGWERDVRMFCAAHDIVYQGFSLLTANRAELASPTMKQIAQRTARSIPELVFRFAVQVGMLPLTGTSSFEHMRSHLASLDSELDAREIAAIERIAE